jgi:hypothetical protein
MNARRAPGLLFRDHAKDQVAQFCARRLSFRANSMPREPRPAELEPRPMPANYGLRLHKDQCLLPSRPEPPQDNPEEFVTNGKSRLRMPFLEDSELLPQSQIFQEQITTGAKEADRNDR